MNSRPQLVWNAATAGLRRILNAVALCAILLVTPLTLTGQRGGPPGGGGPGHGGPGGMGPGGPGMGAPPLGGSSAAPGSSSGTRSSLSKSGAGVAGLSMGPVGRWWDDKTFARSLGIDSGQQHRMDSVFNSNRDALLARYTDLKREEAEQARLTASTSPDEKRVDAQIERVAQARAELSKATTHMMLALRKELTPEQAAKLENR